MLDPRVNVQMSEELSPQPVVGEHTPDGLLNDPFWPLLDKPGIGGNLQSPWIATVVIVHLLREFFPRYPNFICIYHHHEIPHIKVRGVIGFMLPPQNGGYL